MPPSVRLETGCEEACAHQTLEGSHGLRGVKRLCSSMWDEISHTAPHIRISKSGRRQSKSKPLLGFPLVSKMVGEFLCFAFGFEKGSRVAQVTLTLQILLSPPPRLPKLLYLLLHRRHTLEVLCEHISHLKRAMFISKNQISILKGMRPDSIP